MAVASGGGGLVVQGGGSLSRDIKEVFAGGGGWRDVKCDAAERTAQVVGPLANTWREALASFSRLCGDKTETRTFDGVNGARLLQVTLEEDGVRGG